MCTMSCAVTGAPRRFVSNALPPNATGYISNAYDNTFIQLNMTQLFSTTV